MTRVARQREGWEWRTRPEAQFETVVQALAIEPGVTHTNPGSRFGSSSLKVHDKIFARVSAKGEFVVKLPKARVDDLVADGAGERFDAHRERPMKEWLVVRGQSAGEWLQLAREALDFVGT